MAEIVANDAASTVTDKLSLRVEAASEHHAVRIVAIGVAVGFRRADGPIVDTGAAGDRVSNKEQFALWQRQRIGEQGSSAETYAVEGGRALPRFSALDDLDSVWAGADVGG